MNVRSICWLLFCGGFFSGMFCVGASVSQGQPPAEKQPVATRTIEGRLSGWKKSPKGTVDGLIVDNAQEVKFPSHQAPAIERLCKIGDPVTLTVRLDVSPKGDEKKTLLKLVAKNQTWEADAKDALGNADKAKVPGHQEQILSEIRAMRKMLDPQFVADTKDHKGAPHEQVLLELRGLRSALNAKLAQ